MLEGTATEGRLDKIWHLGFPPTASLHNCLSLRPGSTWLALQCDAAMLVVLDLGKSNDEMPSEVQRLAWNKGGDLMAMAWTEDGRFLVTAHAGDLGALSVFQVDSENRLTQVLHCPVFFWPKDLCVSMSGDESSQLIIAVGGSPGVVLYKACIDEGSGRWKLQQAGRLCHLWPVCAVMYGPGGRHLAAAGLGGQLCIWDLNAGDARLELQVQVPAERVTSLAFSACGQALAVACWGGAVFLYLQQDGALDPALLANSTAASELGVGFQAEAAHACNFKACPVQGGGHVLPAAAPGDDDMAAQGNDTADESRPGAIEAGNMGTHAEEAAALYTRCVGSSPAQGGGQVGPAAVSGNEVIVEGDAAAHQSQPVGIALDIGSAHVEAVEQDTCSVSPSAAAQGGAQAGLAAAAHREDTVAQGAPAAYESRLAAIDHGIEGAGGWHVGAACLPGQPIKADLTGPTLLEWVGDDMLLVTLPSGGLTVLRMEGASLVQEKPCMAAAIDASTWPKATGSAMASQIDKPRWDMESHDPELPSGLRVLPLGRAQGWSQVPAGVGTCNAGMASIVGGDANCVKGLAVMHLAGQYLVACYDRARSLRMVPVADL
ncbi:hypothetical protein COCOBI_10-4020 [Coccomyxa sp. Obi]|nr:hypothetical protein COCOBI_10-4020 [Coccomyxa sp. Obi]